MASGVLQLRKLYLFPAGRNSYLAFGFGENLLFASLPDHVFVSLSPQYGCDVFDNSLEIAFVNAFRSHRVQLLPFRADHLCAEIENAATFAIDNLPTFAKQRLDFH